MTFKDFLILLEGFSNNPSEVKYHRDIYWPPTAVRDLATFLIRLPEVHQSAHWKMERWWKHNYEVSKEDLRPKYAFELAYQNGVLEKVAFRVEHLDPENDIIFVVARTGKVVTTWANRKTDIHKTLNRSAYQTKWPKFEPVAA